MGTQERQWTAAELMERLQQLPPDQVMVVADYDPEGRVKLVRKVAEINEYGEIILSKFSHGYYYDPEDE